MVEGGHKSCNACLSQTYVQWSGKQQSPGEGNGGLKFGKNARKAMKSTPKKTLGIGSSVFCTFSFTPNPIT